MKRITFAIALCLLSAASFAQIEGFPKFYTTDPNDEKQPVENYTLPSLMTCNDGTPVKSIVQWEQVRRPEILEIFATQMFGPVPAAPEGLHFSLLKPDETVYDGAAIRRYVRIFLDSKEKHHFDIMIHKPAKHCGKIPFFVALNFRSLENSFDGTRYELPYEMIVRQGFGIAVAFHESIEADCKDGEESEGAVRLRGKLWPKDDHSAISVWAWGLSRMADYLETLEEVDCGRLAVIGHSRLGKTALWAGANDKRFSLMISNNSGCCGAAISRRMYGETFADIYRNFPYWFVPAFSKYVDGKESEFPADQHELIALSAPRAVYVASADEDEWADPAGEWLAAKEASPVYELYGLKGLTGKEMPALGHTDDYGQVAYKIRFGGHALYADDWLDYIKYAKRIFCLDN